MLRLRRSFPLILLVLATLVPSQARATTLYDFESASSLTGWPLTGNAWSRASSASGSFTLNPYEGSFLVKSGDPTTASEANTGTIRSPALLPTQRFLSFATAGWGNTPGNTLLSYFQILDAGLLEIGN